MTVPEARAAELLEGRVAQLEEELRKAVLDGEQQKRELAARDEKLKSFEGLRGGNGAAHDRTDKVNELTERWRGLMQENGSLKFSLKTRREQLQSSSPASPVVLAAPGHSPKAAAGTRQPAELSTSSSRSARGLPSGATFAQAAVGSSPVSPASPRQIASRSLERPASQLASTSPGPSSAAGRIQDKSQAAPQECSLLKASQDFGEDARVLRRLVEANGDLKAKRGWFDAVPSLDNVSRWSGVTCAHGRVTELQVQVVAMPEALGMLSAMVSLDLSNSDGLVTLPDSLGKLSALTSLKLSGCSSIVSLPMTIGSCRSLSSVHLGGCKALRSLPDTLGSLKALKRLDMWHCKQVKALPKSVGGLSSITALSLRYCEGLAALPEHVCDLPALKTLDLCGCSGLAALPVRISELPALRRLDLKGCTSLSATGAETIKRLRSQGCEVMMDAP